MHGQGQTTRMFFMKKVVGGALLLLGVLACGFFGKKALTRWQPEIKNVKVSTVAESLARVCTPSAEKNVEIVVIASDCEGYCTRQIESFLSQQYGDFHVTYMEHGSTDETYARALHAASKCTEGKKLDIVRLEKGKNIVEGLYHHIHGLDPETLVMVLDGFTFLSHEKVLEHINHAYANPDVWMTCSREINHPNYDGLKGENFSDTLREANRAHAKKVPTLFGAVSFYAKLGMEIKLSDFIKEGHFKPAFTPVLLTLPMYEMASGHLHFMEEVMTVHADKGKSREQKEKIELHSTVRFLAKKEPYTALSHLSMPMVAKTACDVAIFSQDKPLHLYSALESIKSYLPMSGKISVIYMASDKEFERGYLQVEKAFKKVDFLRISDFEGGDFSALFSSVVTPRRGESPYTMLITDTHFLTSPIDIQACQKLLSQTHADTFLLSIDQQRLSKSTLPGILSITDQCMAWQVDSKGYPFPFTIGLFEKKRLSTLVSSTGLSSWTVLKKQLEKNLKKGSVLLSFKENKTVAIDPVLSHKQLKKWAKCLFEGYKIDLKVLDADLEEIKQGDYPLVKRDRK